MSSSIPEGRLGHWNPLLYNKKGLTPTFLSWKFTSVIQQGPHPKDGTGIHLCDTKRASPQRRSINTFLGEKILKVITAIGVLLGEIDGLPW